MRPIRGDIDCDCARLYIEKLGDGPLGRLEQARLSSHLASCSDCSLACARMEAVVDALSMMPKVETPPGLAGRVVEIVAGIMSVEEEIEAGERGRKGLAWIAGAAVFGVALAVGYAVLRRLTGRDGDAAALGPA